MIDGISVEMEGSMEGRNVKPGGWGLLGRPGYMGSGCGGVSFLFCFVWG